MIRLCTGLFVLWAAACGPSHSDDAEACEHLQNGPAASLAAATGTATPPAVRADHRRYDVTLVDVTGGKGGKVSFAAAAASDHLLFLSADVPVEVTDGSGQKVAPKSTASSSRDCAEVKARLTLPLAVGTYALSFGPTSLQSVNLVLEQAHEH